MRVGKSQRHCAAHCTRDAAPAIEAEGGVVPHPAALALPAALTPNAQAGADFVMGGGALVGLHASFERQSIATSPVDDRTLKREDAAACSKLNCPVLDAPSFSRHLNTREKQSAGKRQTVPTDADLEEQNKKAGKLDGQGKDREQSGKHGGF